MALERQDPKGPSSWEDGRNSVLPNTGSINFVRNINAIIDEDLQYLSNYLTELSKQGSQKLSPAASKVESLLGDLKKSLSQASSTKLDDESLTSIEKSLLDLKVALNQKAFSEQLNQHMSRERREQSIEAYNLRSKALGQNKEFVSPKVTTITVDSINTDINRCLAGIKKHLQATSVSSSVSTETTAIVSPVAALHEQSQKENKSTEDGAQVEKQNQQELNKKQTENKRQILANLNQNIAERKASERSVEGIAPSLISLKTDPISPLNTLDTLSQSRQGLLQKFEQERDLMHETLESERKSQLDNIEKRVNEQKLQPAIDHKDRSKTQLSQKTPVVVPHDKDDETNTTPKPTRRVIDPLRVSTRSASQKPNNPSELSANDENTRVIDISEEKRQDILEGSSAPTGQSMQAAAVNIQKVFRGFSGRKEAKEEYVKQLIGQLEVLTQNLAKANSREDIDKIETARSDWGTKEDNFYDKHLKGQDSDSQENQDILSRITEQNNKYGKALAEAASRIQIKEASVGLFATSAPEVTKAAPELQLSTNPTPEKDVTPPPPALETPFTGTKAPPSTPFVPSRPASIASALLSKLEDLENEFTGERQKSIDRESVLSFASKDQTQEIVYNQKNFCEELEKEYSIKGTKTGRTFSKQDDVSAKKISFSADGKTVALPDDNIIEDTVLSLNLIASSNISNHNNNQSTASIKIKNVQEENLLPILEKFNADILGDDYTMGLKGHLQLSYENPNKESPNEPKIQEIIKQHNDLHSLLKADSPEPEKVQDKLKALQTAITTLQRKLEMQHAASTQEAVHGTLHSRNSLR